MSIYLVKCNLKTCISAELRENARWFVEYYLAFSDPVLKSTLSDYRIEEDFTRFIYDFLFGNPNTTYPIIENSWVRHCLYLI